MVPHVPARQTTPPGSPSAFRLYLLGSLRLEKAGRAIKLPRRKSESLLAYLALYPQAHAREKLAALFWGESTDRDARCALRVALTDLRKALGAEAFLADRHTLQLNPDFPLWSDAIAFSQSAKRVSQELAPDFIGELRFMLCAYTELLSDFYDDWLEPRREELRALFLDAALQLIAHFRTRGEYKHAMELAQKILTVDRAHEAAHQHLMFCHSASGDRAAALDQYEFCRRALREELDVEPACETRELYEQIRKQTETKSLAARLTNLPHPTTSFVGRQRELRELRELIPQPSSLITLLGPGGSGKTRLAIEIGSRLVSEFPDGVWWVDLAPLAEQARVPDAVARVLGVREQSDQPLTETLVEFLRGKQVLMMLDNCEHLIEACAQLVQELSSNSRIAILTTSREALNVPGERVYLVATLAVPTLDLSMLLTYDAVKLFVERAAARQPSFQLTDKNAAAIVEICQRLDGIPLALELAAARITALVPEQIAARLDDRFGLLTGGSRAALPRQQTLRALIDWSFDLLNDEEKILFRRLSVFAGGWTLEAAQQVCASDSRSVGSPDAVDHPTIRPSDYLTLETLTRLVEKSLVVFDIETARYTFLETIREYAREKLEVAGERDVWQARHFAYFVQLAEIAEPELRGPKLIQWGDRLEAELDNLRAALGWALAQPDANLSLRLAGALPIFWMRRGHVNEGLNWYEKALAKSGVNNDPLYLARAYSGAGVLAGLQGDFANQCKLHAQALEYFEQTNDKSGAAYALYYFGGGLYWQGEVHRAKALVEQALRDARAVNANWVVTHILNFLGIISMAQGDTDTALRHFEEALALAQGDGDAGLATSALHNLGAIESARGNFPRASELLAQALRLAEARHQTAVVVTTLEERALLFVRQGEYAAAVQACQRGAQLALESSFKQFLARTLEWAGAAFGYLNQFERAARLWGVANALRESINAGPEPAYVADYEKAVAYVREQLGEERFAELLAGGRGMDMNRVHDLISNSPEFSPTSQLVADL